MKAQLKKKFENFKSEACEFFFLRLKSEETFSDNIKWT